MAIENVFIDQTIAAINFKSKIRPVFSVGYKNWNIMQMVQEWVSDPSTNFGLMLNSDSSAASDSNRYFRSTEYSNPDQRPKLTITYEFPIILI
ncbi:MAG: DNRLRE domain-containing protein [Planctomycetota bacterium]|jgi:hypothetical protein